MASISTLFVVARGIPAFTAWDRAQRADATAAAAQLTAARVGRRTLPALRDSLAARRARLAALDSVLIAASTPAVAAAELASLLSDLAEQSSVRVNAMQLRADSAAMSTLAIVAVRVTAVADVYGLTAFLRAIEGNDAPFAVRELSVTQPEASAPDSKRESLRAEIVVESVARLTGAREK